MTTTVADLLRTLADVVQAAGDEPVEVSARVGKWTVVLTSREGGRVLVPPAVVDEVHRGPWHSNNFQRVEWPGHPAYHFGLRQARVVAALWEARDRGTHDVPETELLRIAGSTGDRLADLFRRHPAWRTLIIHGSHPGTYRLPPTPAPACSVITPPGAG
jgi:hypothetical protein